MKEFLEKFFDLCREYQEEIPPKKMAEILRDYADRLDGSQIVEMNIELLKLKNVNLRETQSHEAQDFTPWLADNLEYLSNEIGIQLELEV